MKNFILAFILFALLLTVNAAPFQLNKRTITFSPCPPSDPVDFLTVKIDPDPPVSEKSESFDVSGNLTENDITKGKTFLFIGYADKDLNPIGDDYSQNFAESIKAGTPFNISASDVPTPELPDSYFLGVGVLDPTGDPTNPYILYACALAKVGISSEKSKNFDFYKLI
ncbi:hypothetical protein F8M41_015182 [Gigaspora margarita]|uniref:MD-2-related lipid-recognition domain-containing protein n=1 Tax=Gigaspora margarita TaxID=4874 RepID=A0A8H4AQU4_GIGMA|nr:hypothetical protein F8M41_015182 [Gigaspora margarita]